MKKTTTFFSALCCAFAILMTGCEGGGGDGEADVGDNAPNTVACIGDSIMAGYACEGAPFTQRLAAKSGMTVLNYAKPGAETRYGVAIIDVVLAQKPGYVCIMLGSNDATKGRDAQSVKANISAIVAACKNNRSVPIVAMPPRMAYAHSIHDGHCKKIGEAVREAASEQGAKVIDMYSAFGSNPEQYLNPADGLHLSEAGGELLADKFNGAL